ncbi:hypothetical protein DMUE_0743 [Dictyocoela muelleri]|nr:hypothetical protein DMUE_0743 [Dictyocoela muelleri]
MVEMKKSSERGIINCPPSSTTVIPLIDKSDASIAKSNQKLIDSCEMNLILKSKSMISRMIYSPLSNKSDASAAVFSKIRMKMPEMNIKKSTAMKRRVRTEMSAYVIEYLKRNKF